MKSEKLKHARMVLGLAGVYAFLLLMAYLVDHEVPHLFEIAAIGVLLLFILFMGLASRH